MPTSREGNYGAKLNLSKLTVKVRPTLLHFPPYSKQDIVEIISARLAKVPNSDTVVTSAAVHLLAGKVFNEVYENVVVQQCEAGADSFPIHQKLAVCSLLLMLKHGKSKEAQLGKLHETYSRVCKGRHVVPVQQS
ncbi:Cell division control protein 6 [Amphibalanus amphitrite]|uniref:Cell division control protein 6 n=1 Tax=Amphibalanus amphitrite TaxID=1232801 RepID=A0A6A4WNS9_AMPAM|nr:Cell division control protein 6 [Amphibalanus amphitrite]